MKQSQRIAKNITVMVSSEMVGFGMNFLITVLIARYLGVIGFGQYSFVFAFVGFFQLIADSGLSNIMIREISVRKERLKEQLGVTKSLIWALSLIVFLIIVIIINFIRVEPAVVWITYIMGAAVLATVHAIGYNAIFRAMEEMEYSALGFVLHKFLLLGLVLGVIKLKLGLREIAFAYLIANSSLWLFYYQIVVRRYGRVKMLFDINAWRFYLAEALPVGVASVLRKISWQVDILILTAIGTAASVGLFSAPYKIMQSVNMLSNTIAVTLFPLYARLGKSSFSELFRAYENGLKVLYTLSVPMVVILSVYARHIVLLCFGPKYAESYIALQILSFTVLFLFPTAQFVYLFSALGRQRLYTICSLASLAINIVLDFVLIPRLDFVGACVGTLVAEISLFLVGMSYAKSLEKDISFVRAAWKPAVSGALMLVVMAQFRDLNVFLLIAGVLAGLLVYVAANYFLKTFSNEELRALMKSVLFMKKAPVQGSAKG